MHHTLELQIYTAQKTLNRIIMVTGLLLIHLPVQSHYLQRNNFQYAHYTQRITANISILTFFFYRKNMSAIYICRAANFKLEKSCTHLILSSIMVC